MIEKMSAIAFPLKLGALVVLLSLTGCYNYSEAALGSVSPGTRVRLRLNEDGFGRVVNQAAMSGAPMESMDHNRRGFVGRIMDIGPDNMSVEMRGGGGSTFTAEVLTGAIQGLAVRSLSKPKTFGTLAGGVALFAMLVSGDFYGTTSTEPPVEPEHLVPISFLSIPFP